MGRAKTASGPAFILSITLSAREGAAGQAVVCRLLRGSSPTRGVAPKRHRGWFSLSLGAWVPKKLARRRMQLWLMASAAPSASPRPDRNGAMLLDRLGPPGFRFNDFRGPRLPYLSASRVPSALRGREGAAGQAVVCPLLRGSSPTRGVAPKQHRVPALTLP